MPEGSLPRTNAGWAVGPWIGVNKPRFSCKREVITACLVKEGGNKICCVGLRTPSESTEAEFVLVQRLVARCQGREAGLIGEHLSVSLVLARKSNILCQTLHRSGSRWESQRMFILRESISMQVPLTWHGVRLHVDDNRGKGKHNGTKETAWSVLTLFEWESTRPSSPVVAMVGSMVVVKRSASTTCDEVPNSEP